MDLADPKHGGYFASAARHFANGADFVIRKLSVVSAFLDHVSVVVFRRPKPQMIRVDAFSIIAMMKDAHSFWDWSVVSSPCDSVDVVVFPEFSNHSVATTIQGSGPINTIIHRRAF